MNDYELIRHISLPIVTNSVFDLSSNQYVDYITSIPSVNILPSKIYKIQNFSYNITYLRANAVQNTVINNAFNLSFKSPSLIICGLPNNLDATFFRALYPTGDYTYNGTLNNPNLSLAKSDILTNRSNLEVGLAPLLPNTYSVDANFSSVPSAYYNVIDQKSTGILNPLSVVSDTASGGLRCSQYNLTRNVSTDDFFFMNNNYNTLSMFFTPIEQISGLSCSLVLQAFLNFDLIQYSA